MFAIDVRKIIIFRYALGLAHRPLKVLRLEWGYGMITVAVLYANWSENTGKMQNFLSGMGEDYGSRTVGIVQYWHVIYSATVRYIKLGDLAPIIKTWWNATLSVRISQDSQKKKSNCKHKTPKNATSKNVIHNFPLSFALHRFHKRLNEARFQCLGAP